jgi:hypothetical protein
VLTEVGRKACVDGTRLQQESEQVLLDALTPDEAQQLGTLLEKVGRPRG